MYDTILVMALLESIESGFQNHHYESDGLDPEDARTILSLARRVRDSYEESHGRPES
jgi:hypothetical protein